MMVIRGGNSEILSAQTLEVMRSDMPGSNWWRSRMKVTRRR
jgi:hypothetical protein